jgi:acetyl esterase/lipase
VQVAIIRPEGTETLPCVYYIHGGGMQTMSCFNGMYQAWGRIIAAQGVAVVMVDFRNALRPSSAPEVAPFPAGLNDCVSAVKWVAANAARSISIRPASSCAGESGGGNSHSGHGAEAAADGDIGLIQRLYAFCPYIAGRWPHPDSPSSGREQRHPAGAAQQPRRHGLRDRCLERRDPLAWPGFATEVDVKGLPPTVISVNECDPLRDEGVNFYRLLLRPASRLDAGKRWATIHGTEIFSIACPEISRTRQRTWRALRGSRTPHPRRRCRANPSQLRRSSHPNSSVAAQWGNVCGSPTMALRSRRRR